jgi:uncharacterized membrane protein
MIRLLALVLALLPVAVRAEVYPALHDVTGVAADDVLNIRATASAEALVIGALAPNATGIEVVAVQDGWAVVNTGEGSGFAALRFLSRTTAPDWPTLEVPLTCLGTEPFWTLEIDPGPGETRFQTPEDEAPRSAPISASWPGLPWSQTAAVSLPEGIAVLAPALCSYGMSDQSYGIAADLFLSGPDRTRLSGCCRLGLR